MSLELLHARFASLMHIKMQWLEKNSKYFLSHPSPKSSISSHKRLPNQEKSYATQKIKSLWWHCTDIGTTKNHVSLLCKFCSKHHNPWICLSLRLRQFYLSLSASKFHCFDFLGKTCENAVKCNGICLSMMRFHEFFHSLNPLFEYVSWWNLRLSRFSKTFSMFMYQRSSKEEPLKSYDA